MIQKQNTAAGSTEQKQPRKNTTGQRKNTGQRTAPSAPKKEGQVAKQPAQKSAQKPAGSAQRPSQPRNKKSFNTQRRRPSAPPATPVNIYPLGGLGEIGKNMTVYECNGDMMIVDCGSLFPDSDMYGVDLVIPDFAFVEQNRDKIRGIAITHGHEDHIGALPYLLRELNIPVYGTRLTLGLIGNKLEEHGLRSSVETHVIVPGEAFRIGCFSITAIHVNHSIPDAVAYAIESPAGTIIQTGDFKVDYTPIGGGVIDLNAFAEYGKKGVLALLSDSTNAERPGMSASERTVHDNLETLFTKAENHRVIVATFASNLYRVQQIIDLAVKYGRKVAISGRSMVNNTKMARELGYLRAPDEVLIELEQMKNYPPDKVALITTGSQGETMSALSRMAQGTHRNVQAGPGDFIIISATPIPGNEKMVTRVVNGLLKLGAEVIYEKMYEIHASGHACQEEQKLILDLVRPQFFMPVHGEYKQLKRHASIAEAMGIPSKNIIIADTGDTIRLSRNGVAMGESVQAGAVMVDGLGVGDVGSVVLRDRRLLSQDGIVIVAATVDATSGDLLTPVELFSRGFVYVKESETLLEETRNAVQRALEKYSEEQHRDLNSLKTKVRETASSLLYRRTKRSPMILPVITEV